VARGSIPFETFPITCGQKLQNLNTLC